jgi:predicted ATPase/DNA-binding winged helix-turn-helix (wHTH) protein
MDHLTAPARSVAFGPFRLFAVERLLLKDGVALPVSSRALDILMLLVERAGEVVGKKDLIARAWPNLTVDESSLRVHIAGLRKALGDGRAGARYVTNVPGRGYCFVAPVTSVAAPNATSTVAPARAGKVHELPPRLARLVGRDETIRLLSQELLVRRFVTIHGPGGIGKTTVAVAVGHTLLDSFEGDIRFFDLGSISEPHILPSAIASGLGLLAQASDPMPSLLNFLRSRRMVLIFDSCEHVIEAVAALAERIFQETSEVHILATSREALRVEGERVYRLSALDSPPEDMEVSAARVLSFPATALLVERAAASGYSFQLTDADAPIIADICRKLDGIALAIELAARRVGAYGLRETATLLDNRLGLLWRGRRTALPRHQTLSATLDWSYDLLTDLERTVLRRLSVFVGPFTLEAAQAVAVDDELDDLVIVETVAALVAKSLISTSGDAEIRYRLLDTTRTYAIAKLAAGAEADQVAQRHAAYYRKLLETGGGSGVAVNAEHVGNIRTALQWSFSERGNVELATALAAASAATLIEMSLLNECCYWVERALSILDDRDRGSRREMELQSSLGMSLIYSKGHSEQAHAALNRALHIAEALGDSHSQLRLLGRLHVFYRRAGNFIGALDAARRSEAVATKLGEPLAIATAHSLLGVSFHLLGSQHDARYHLEASLIQPPASRDSDSARLGFDRYRDRARVALARTLWLHGYPDQALRLARQAVEQTRGHPVTTSIVLTWATFVLYWAGDLDGAETCIERAIVHAGAHSLTPFQTAALGLRGELRIMRGDVDAGMDLVRTSLAALHADRYEMYTASLGGALAAGFAIAGQLDRALTTIDGIIAAAEPNGDLFLPELLRLRGTFLDQAGDAHAAERCFLQSIELAGRQAAPSWQLRTSMDLARLRVKQDRRAEGHEVLAAAYARFTEGFETRDLKAARRLLDELAEASTMPARTGPSRAGAQ